MDLALASDNTKPALPTSHHVSGPEGRRRRRFLAVSGWIGFLTLDEPAIALLLRFRLRITGAPYAETILSLAFGGWEVTLDELELYDYPFTEDQVSAAFQATQPMR